MGACFDFGTELIADSNLLMTVTTLGLMPEHGSHRGWREGVSSQEGVDSVYD
jgi:hypothetical protein